MSEWGRVAEDGTVYVTTADGERAVGSWQAGSPEEGLALFVRRYEQLSTEVSLLEQRLRTGAGDPNAVRQSAQRLKTTVPTASAVGDLAGLEARVDGLLERTEEAAEQAKAKKAEARAHAAEQKAALAEEAERLAGSSSGRPPASGCAASATTGSACRTWTRRPTTSCGSGSRPPARASPSGARRTSQRSASSAR
jgi:hypothetical protein